VVLSFKFYRITYSPPSRCSQIHMLCLLQVLVLMVGLGEILCLMLLRKCVINLPLSFMLATLRLYFHVKMKKWLLENWDPNAKETRLAFGYQKLL
jgi:hypothetical protein